MSIFNFCSKLNIVLRCKSFVYRVVLWLLPKLIRRRGYLDCHNKIHKWKNIESATCRHRWKGLFIKGMDEALINGDIDIPLHHEIYSYISSRQDNFTLQSSTGGCAWCIYFLTASSLVELPARTIAGTASLRRKSQILHRYLSLKVSIIFWCHWPY